MLNFQKSIELNKAGFPKPNPEFGQFWYSSNGNLWIIGRLSPDADCVAIAVQDTSWEHLRDMNGFVFAPTEKDILAELQKACRNGFWWALTAPDKSDNLWGCANFERNEGKNNEFLSGCPTEACADAYLFTFSIS